jgi:rhodanese-related sulfurtransferase
MNWKKIIVWGVAALFVGAGVLAVAMPVPSVDKGIGNDELLQLQGSGALVVDVRTTAEFGAGHIASAVNVPLDMLHQAAASWDKNQAVVVYCATGARSAEAASYLAGAGFKKVHDLTGGVVAWDKGPVGGSAAASAPTGSGAIKTNGKPVFIEFATST